MNVSVKSGEPHRTLIVGRTEAATKLAQSFDDGSSGFVPVGFVTAGSPMSQTNGLPHLGSIDDLATLIVSKQVDCLFVAGSAVRETDILKIVQVARQQGAEVWLTANMPEMLSSRLGVQALAGTMAMSLRPVNLTGSQRLLKRTFDLLAGAAGLLLLGPFLLLIALAIKLTSDGPVLFKQRRVTKDGVAFTMFKFRSMRVDTNHSLRREGLDSSAAFFKMEQQDPRITKVGRILRKLSLDELPQLLNVVKGDMSLVGPRPLPSEQVASNLELLGPRHEVPAGMTGWWQIQGRSDVDPKEAVRLDLFYIENWSLPLDLYILLKTVGAVLAKRGAR